MFTTLKKGERYIEDKEGIYTEFVCSSVADVAGLPTGAGSDALDRPRPGSTAVVPGEDGASASVYVLTNEREWALLLMEG